MNLNHRVDNWFLGHERSLYRRRSLIDVTPHRFKPDTGVINPSKPYWASTPHAHLIQL